MSCSKRFYFGNDCVSILSVKPPKDMRIILSAAIPWLLLRGFMKESHSKSAFIGAMNLLMVSAPAFADQSSGLENHGPEEKQPQVALNAASLKSIESSWLEVPATCKARGFNASPITLGEKEAGPAARLVFAALEA